jgi:Rrf2 family protein
MAIFDFIIVPPDTFSGRAGSYNACRLCRASAQCNRLLRALLRNFISKLSLRGALSTYRVEKPPAEAHKRIMLSQKTRYAIRAMQHLADLYGTGPVQLADIAEAQKIPPKFLTVILSELSRSGLVASQRGKDGGYWLGVSPIDISYGDLIRIMRGSLALVPCASRYAHEKCKNCVEEDNCRTRALMLQVRDKTADLLDSIHLSDNVDAAQLLQAAE